VNRAIFDIGAVYYDLVTARLSEWRADCAQLAMHLQERDRFIVDIGTGPGVSAYEVAAQNHSVTVLGVDISQIMLRRALRNRQRYSGCQQRVHFVRADARELPLMSASVDVVTTHSTLYLVSDRRAVLREVRRLLRPGGRAILFEPRRERRAVPGIRTWLRSPAYAWTMVLWGIVSRFEGAFGEGELRELVQEAGLKVDEDTQALEGYGGLIIAHAASG
jgi:ubiquinone/menaquinone biosynthesis C-methylase UbiE